MKLKKRMVKKIEEGRSRNTEYLQPCIRTLYAMAS